MQNLAKDFEKQTYRDRSGGMLPYRLLMPGQYDAGHSYPLVLFLHGAGEKGSENVRQITNGVENFATKKIRTAYPCFVVVPQCPRSAWWTDLSDTLQAPLRQSFAILALLQEEFSVDERRIYITGISMGGFGTWDAVTRKPGYFAAAVPVCGGGNVKKASLIKDLPLWAFHGAKDPVVPVQYSRDMVAALRAAGGAPRYTEYPDAGHNSWDLVYADPAMYAWFFEQEKRS